MAIEWVWCLHDFTLLSKRHTLSLPYCFLHTIYSFDREVVYTHANQVGINGTLNSIPTTRRLRRSCKLWPTKHIEDTRTGCWVGASHWSEILLNKNPTIAKENTYTARSTLNEDFFIPPAYHSPGPAATPHYSKNFPERTHATDRVKSSRSTSTLMSLKRFR